MKHDLSHHWPVISDGLERTVVNGSLKPSRRKVVLTVTIVRELVHILVVRVHVWHNLSLLMDEVEVLRLKELDYLVHRLTPVAILSSVLTGYN